jgi:hypothetical protein
MSSGKGRVSRNGIAWHGSGAKCILLRGQRDLKFTGGKDAIIEEAEEVHSKLEELCNC